MKAQIGVIGMSVMGKNLALNIESRGYKVAVYNRSENRTKNVLRDNPDANLVPSYTLEDFIDSLQSPKKVLIMVQAGNATDIMVNKVKGLLSKDDIIVDCGNTFFEDTIRRAQQFEDTGISYIGMGVSGGEEGALKGPSIMPGGPKEAVEELMPILNKIAAKAPGDQKPCVNYIGENGSGHYVKMIHNGIEYGDMQLIAESYDIMRRVLNLKVSEIGNYFHEWNKGELNSYLIEITADILSKIDPKTQEPMIDSILDKAGNKGTGKWTSQSALDLGVPLPTITESVFARYISAMKEDRLVASEILSGPEVINSTLDNTNDLIEEIRQALFFSKIMSYAQGFVQLREANKEYNWNMNYKEIAELWRGGCIIRAQFLAHIMTAFERNNNLPNILLDDYFKEIVAKYQQSARKIITLAMSNGIPVPGLMSAVSYYDSYRTDQLPANLLQAQRDYFGAHTYERIDEDGVFHYNWSDETEEKWS